jgi:hypothetical protein
MRTMAVLLELGSWFDTRVPLSEPCHYSFTTVTRSWNALHMIEVIYDRFHAEMNPKNEHRDCIQIQVYTY